MRLFKKKLPPVPEKAEKVEIIDATIKEKEIDYKAEYEKLMNKPAEKPQEAQELPKIEETEAEEDKTKENPVLKLYKEYVVFEGNNIDTIKINLLFAILDELKKLNEKAE